MSDDLEKLTEALGLTPEQVKKMAGIMDEVYGKAEAHIAGDFPDHQHLWEVNVVQNVPVGVTCRVCDRSFVTDLDDRPPQRTIAHAQPPLLLEHGTDVVVVMRKGDAGMLMRVDSVNMSSGINRGTVMSVDLSSVDWR